MSLFLLSTETKKEACLKHLEIANLFNNSVKCGNENRVNSDLWNINMLCVVVQQNIKITGRMRAHTQKIGDDTTPRSPS